MLFDKYKYKRDFFFKDDRIFLTEEGRRKIRRPKKLTGSRIGAVFGHDSFKSPFMIWCDILGFYKEEPDMYFLKAGTVIEPKLRSYAERKMNKRFVEYSPRDINYDLFSHDPIFGGIPDGEEMDDRGNVVSILEIKTAQLDKYKWVLKDNQMRLDVSSGRPEVVKKGGGLSKWFKNGEVMIPENYQDQLALYLYLRNVKKGYFCVAFLRHEDYESPYEVKFSSEFNAWRNYENLEDKLMVTDDHILVWEEYFLEPSFEEKISYAKRWYEDHIIKGVSPKMTTQDLEWFRHGYPDLN